MTKPEFQIEFDKVKTDKLALQDKEEALKLAYLTEHCPVRGGDKVKIIEHLYSGGSREHVAFVRNIWVSEGKIRYSFWNVKKDGTKSSNKLYLNGAEIEVSLIESAKAKEE